MTAISHRRKRAPGALTCLTLCMFLGFGLVGISTSGAHGRRRHPRLRVHVRQPTVRAAQGGRFLIGVKARTRRAARCQAIVRVGRSRARLTRLKADRRGRVGWRWLILPSSPSGASRIEVICQRGRHSGHGSTRVLIITHSRRRKGPIGDPSSLHTPYGEPAGKGGGVCGPFEPGQCTCLAYQKRPDVYNTAVAHGVPRGGRRAAGPEFYVWDGEQWLVNAQHAGIPTGSQPVAGALSCGVCLTAQPTATSRTSSRRRLPRMSTFRNAITTGTAAVAPSGRIRRRYLTFKAMSTADQPVTGRPAPRPRRALRLRQAPRPRRVRHPRRRRLRRQRPGRRPPAG